MKNFVANGDAITITAADNLTSGQGVLIGSIFGVAANDIANGDDGTINLTGVYELPMSTNDPAFHFAPVYWDNIEKNCVGSSANNTLIGVSLGGGGGVVTVRLNGAQIP